jgi:hypothetical protein
LLGRAALGGPWETSWRRIDRRTRRLAAATILLIAAAAVSWGGIWAAYGLRFGPSPDRSVRLDLHRMAYYYTAMTELAVQTGRVPTDAEIEGWKPGVMTRVILRMNDLRVLPQAWLYGLLYTYQSALARDTFLLGEFSKFGRWYYFPVAMLVKTPLATLFGGVLALGVLVIAVRRLGWKILTTWTAACLFVPSAIFLGSAMRSDLNLGLRHILPIYPFLFIGIGLAASYAWREWRHHARRVAIVLALGLAAETLVAFPNFIAFFNVAAGGSRGGLKLLGDSNLDWGQDLKLLAQWQDQHPTQKLYLVYFGLADPWAYGIDYVNFPQGYAFGPQYELRGEPGILAVSATELQGIYQDDVYERLRGVEPLDVLGGTIYLYRWPPPKFDK